MFPLWRYQVIMVFFKISLPTEFLGVGREEEEKKKQNKPNPDSLVAANNQGQVVFTF